MEIETGRCCLSGPETKSADQFKRANELIPETSVINLRSFRLLAPAQESTASRGRPGSPTT